MEKEKARKNYVQEAEDVHNFKINEKKVHNEEVSERIEGLEKDFDKRQKKR